MCVSTLRSVRPCLACPATPSVAAGKPAKAKTPLKLRFHAVCPVGARRCSAQVNRVEWASHSAGAEEMRPMDSTPHPTIGEETAESAALAVERLFTSPGTHPFDTVDWELRDARIGHGDRIAFEQTGVEFPKTWSQNATNIVAQKYFRGQIGHPTRER